MAQFWCPVTDDFTLSISKSAPIQPRNPLATEEILQTIRCTASDFFGLAVYTESRSGSMQDDHIEHVCYPIDNQLFTKIECFMDSINSGDAEAHKNLETTFKHILNEPPNGSPFTMKLP